MTATVASSKQKVSGSTNLDFGQQELTQTAFNVGENKKVESSS